MIAKPVRWNAEKDRLLRARTDRNGIGFDDCLAKIRAGQVIDIIENRSRPGQRAFVLEFGGYAYRVPFVETDDEIFLKTIYPDRKLTRRYLRH
ncbi:MAG: hypothetical protein NXH91_06280 [Phyllobacteriaceae bacterium]|jgi:hypothetical protein|nr:hypothetical protein [Phyllobacteriaceae bacterium]